MRICFDLDNTLCTGYPYEECIPIEGASKLLKDLRAKGHTVIIHTARGMGSSAGNQGLAFAKIGLLTLNQLKDWGFEYDELLLGKASYDIWVDDKSINSINGLLEFMEQSNVNPRDTKQK